MYMYNSPCQSSLKAPIDESCFLPSIVKKAVVIVPKFCLKCYLWLVLLKIKVCTAFLSCLVNGDTYGHISHRWPPAACIILFLNSVLIELKAALLFLTFFAWFTDLVYAYPDSISVMHYSSTRIVTRRIILFFLLFLFR